MRNKTLVPLSAVVSNLILYAISDPCSFSVSYATRLAGMHAAVHATITRLNSTDLSSTTNKNHVFPSVEP